MSLPPPPTPGPGPGPGPYAPPPGMAPPPPPPAHGSRFSVPMLVGLAMAAGGFFLELSYSTYRSENGVVVDCDYHNFGPLLIGPVAVALGLVTLARSRAPGRAHAGREAGAGLLCVAIGVLHVLRGLGMVTLDLTGGSPC